MHRYLCLFVALAALLGGCVAERPLSWTYTIPAGVETPGSRLTARIREGGCNRGDEVIYQVQPRDMSGASIPVPPLDDDALYCFEVVLEDDACAEYARSATMVMVDGSVEMPAVHNVLEVVTARACTGTCDAARGCLLCPPDELYCPADALGAARCCNAVAFDCTDDAIVCEAL